MNIVLPIIFWGGVILYFLGVGWFTAFLAGVSMVLLLVLFFRSNRRPNRDTIQ